MRVRSKPSSFFVAFIVSCSAILSMTACQQPSNTEQAYAPAPAPDITEFAAHWLKSDTLVVAPHYGKTLTLVNKEQPNQRYPLTASESEKWLEQKYPHLANFNSFRLNIGEDELKELIKSPIVVEQINGNKATNVQIANLLDHIFTQGKNDADEVADLGATIGQHGVSFKLWAPTAKAVSLLLTSTPGQAIERTLPLTQDSNTGIWQIQTDDTTIDKYYQYQIKVYHPRSGKVENFITTDPYSLSLSTNSEFSQVVSLNDKSTMPTGWLTQRDNPVKHPEDNIFYETHIRDFSAAEQQLANAQHRGKYLAFTEENSDGIKHIKALKAAGVNSIHLLPTFDIGTIEENQAKVIDIEHTLEQICDKTQFSLICQLDADNNLTLKQYLASLPGDSSQQQKIISALRELDNYNWGYDPFHYTVPEGSYAINPQGKARIVEFRAMVQALHNMGFRVIMDVVYNHTHQAGLEPTAVLDKVVPNYYHRLDPIDGAIAQSTCCDNTATERVMMEKLMIDSLIVWARDYKIDGFRFDLMAHQPKSAMIKARQAIQAIDPDNYFYGEGWNFGEVANNQRFVQASQLELAGTEIGTFTDRLRDAVRGGAFNATGKDIRKSQGIGNGLATFANELLSDTRDQYLTLADQLRIGLTGNLANYPLVTADDQLTLGRDIKYGDQPAGYALDPADTINYVSKHDNQTLWDNNQYRIPYALSTEQRVRMQLQSLSFAMFAQGIPFIHMGSELLRSKGFLRDSYDYGDWFNFVDFSKQNNNYLIGLPPAEKDQQNWSMVTEIIDKNQGRDKPSASDISFSAQAFIDMVKLRMSSPLFRLTNAQDILEKVSFLNTGSQQQLGVIAMKIQGDINTPSIITVFNTTDETIRLAHSEASQYTLHPIQANGSDVIAKQSIAADKHLVVPSLTTAIFIKQQEKNNE